jgi:hypothetical protein
MSTNYERLPVPEDDASALPPTTSLLPLQIEEDDSEDLKPFHLLPRLTVLRRIPRPALYVLALVLGTITMVFVLALSIGIKTPASRGTITMDDIFDGSLSPRRHTIKWLPQCEFRPNDPQP